MKLGIILSEILKPSYYIIKHMGCNQFWYGKGDWNNSKWGYQFGGAKKFDTWEDAEFEKCNFYMGGICEDIRILGVYE